MRLCSDDDDTRDSPLSMSLCSPNSSSSLTLSPPDSPKIVITSSGEGNSCGSDDGADMYAKLTRVKTNSREKLILVPHADGLLNEPKRSLDEVNFCFSCGKENLARVASKTTRRRKNTADQTESCTILRKSLSETSISETPTPTTTTTTDMKTTATTSTWCQKTQPVKRRPRSTSSIGAVGREKLRSSIEKTGAKLVDGLFVTIYREVRLCEKCYTETVAAKSIDSSHILKITSDARAYF